MGTARGADRLANFNDAVAAIAITLLILPLVDAAGAIGAQPVSDFLKDQSDELFAFALSFIVIASYWRWQHSMLEGLRGHNRTLTSVMMLWMVAIVFLPFPTELLSVTHSGQALVYGLYTGTMLVASTALLLESIVISRSPELYMTDEFDLPKTRHAAVATGLLGAGCALSIVFPQIGLVWLFLLFLQDPVTRIYARLNG